MIRNQEDWWKQFDEFYKLLPNLADEFNWNLNLEATESMMKNGKRLGFSVQEQIEKAKEEKNWEFLCRLLNAFWHSAPDEQYIHTIPGWSILCELCSEDWVFYNHQEQSSC